MNPPTPSEDLQLLDRVLSAAIITGNRNDHILIQEAIKRLSDFIATTEIKAKAAKR